MRNGVRQRTRWGTGQTVRGIDLLRGFFVSATSYLYLEIFSMVSLSTRMNLLSRHIGVRSPIQISRNTFTTLGLISPISLQVYTNLYFGRSMCAATQGNSIDCPREQIIIAEPLADAFASSDGVIPPLDMTSLLSGVQQINARLSNIIHRASTRAFSGKAENVAVIGPDELGETVVSVPALLRLREILPKARLVGLFGPEGAPLARTLGTFDEIIVLDFPYMPHQRQRIMGLKGPSGTRQRS